jgi:hypothetical protein
MERLMKYLLNEIIEFLTLSEYFKLKQSSKALKAKLDSTQHLVLKREAFTVFCPHLFSDDNPFRYVNHNSELSNISENILNQ